MEVIKCGLCKEEIKYSQRCRVYIKSNEPRIAQRSSTRPHIGRYKLISTANSTEHISFLRRLKLLNKKKGGQIQSGEASTLNNNKEDINSDSPEPIGEEEKEAIDDNKPSVKKSQLNRKGNQKTSETDKSSKKDMSHPHFQSSFEEYIKPILSKNPSAKVSKTKSSDSNSDLDVNRKNSISTSKTMKNGKTAITRHSLQEFETYYWLDLPKSKQPELKKLGYQFENLVTEVKHMKLPSPEWKIKIMVHKQEMVSVSFSNKQTPEKVVSVNAKNSVCDISIDNKKLSLIGSPVYIYSIKDLEILLDIINEIDPSSSLIQYL